MDLRHFLLPRKIVCHFIKMRIALSSSYQPSVFKYVQFLLAVGQSFVQSSSPSSQYLILCLNPHQKVLAKRAISMLFMLLCCIHLSLQFQERAHSEIFSSCQSLSGEGYGICFVTCISTGHSLYHVPVLCFDEFVNGLL
mmetsp:Transcript_12214/g.21166  ORF Transcript_12214/g.21166 Transcript_12214/m.21166 type:complete len:139 (+) Transcript_12214:253-669(+)